MDVFRLQKGHDENGRELDPSSGDGAAKYGGRWNHKGRAVVYCSESRALSALEYLVQLTNEEGLPTDIHLARFQIPETDKVESVASHTLPEGWNGPKISSATQDIGTKWLESGDSAALRVPSALIPEEHNYLLNPCHAGFKEIALARAGPFRFDARLRPPASQKPE